MLHNSTVDIIARTTNVFTFLLTTQVMELS